MNSVLMYPGAKWCIASWIISYFPKHHSYLEPFFGSGGVEADLPGKKRDDDPPEE